MYASHNLPQTDGCEQLLHVSQTGLIGFFSLPTIDLKRRQSDLSKDHSPHTTDCHCHCDRLKDQSRGKAGHSLSVVKKPSHPIDCYIGWPPLLVRGCLCQTGVPQHTADLLSSQLTTAGKQNTGFIRVLLAEYFTKSCP